MKRYYHIFVKRKHIGKVHDTIKNIKRIMGPWFEQKGDSLHFFAIKKHNNPPGSNPPRGTYWKCKRCGTVFNLRASSLNAYTRCPKCNGRDFDKVRGHTHVFDRQGKSKGIRFCSCGRFKFVGKFKPIVGIEKLPTIKKFLTNPPTGHRVKMARVAYKLAYKLYKHFKDTGIPPFVVNRIPASIKPYVVDILRFNGVKIRSGAISNPPKKDTSCPKCHKNKWRVFRERQNYLATCRNCGWTIGSKPK